MSIYLTTLRRIPGDVILSMATRPIDLDKATECVCGWAAREIEARRLAVDAEDVRDINPTPLLSSVLGPAFERRIDWWSDGWARINGADPNGPSGSELEEAFVERVLECIS